MILKLGREKRLERHCSRSLYQTVDWVYLLLITPPTQHNSGALFHQASLHSPHQIMWKCNNRILMRRPTIPPTEICCLLVTYIPIWGRL